MISVSNSKIGLVQQDDGIPITHYMTDEGALESVQNHADEPLEEEHENEENAVIHTP